jgi:hypothetical protein
VERRGDRLFAVYKLSEPPDVVWRAFFRQRARFSIFDVQRAVFTGNEVHIELPRAEELDMLTASVDRFIEGANLDYPPTRRSGGR